METYFFSSLIILSISNLASHLLVVAGMLIVFFLFYSFKIRKFKKRNSPSDMMNALGDIKFLKQLINNIPDRIYIKDRESKFQMANIHVARVMGVKKESHLLGKTDFDFYSESIAREYFEDEQRIMQEGLPLINKEEVGLDLEGNMIHVSTTKIPIKGENGEIIGIVGIGRDINSLKIQEEKLKKQSASLKDSNILLEERQEEILHMAEELNAQTENLREVNAQLEKLSIVASNTENIVIIMDGNANFTWANKAFEDKYGVNLEDFIKVNGPNLRDNSANDNISAILNQIYITKKPFTYSSMMALRGEERWYQTNITPILDSEEEISKLILIDSDITELKLAERKINRQKKVLQEQARELELNNATKDRLFSIIAHDLRNPFHSILGFSEILQTRYQDIEREKLGEYLGMIEESAKSAFDLLENLLEWARTQTNRIRFNPIKLNLKDVVNEVIHLIKLHAANKEIAIIDELSDNLFIVADKNMLSTIIRNITGNSIKFTKAGGTITYKGYIEEDEVVIQIIDTGIGMPDDKINSLFKLEKINSTAGTEGETGTGLGLIVCDEFMKRNNANIQVDSLPGKGTTFTLRFPNNTII